jgi:hypothetical protein
VVITGKQMLRRAIGTMLNRLLLLNAGKYDEQQEITNDMIINLVSEQKEESEEEENEVCTEV